MSHPAKSRFELSSPPLRAFFAAVAVVASLGTAGLIDALAHGYGSGVSGTYAAHASGVVARG